MTTQPLVKHDDNPGGTTPPPGASDALDAIAPEMGALAPSEILSINIDIPRAALRALGVASTIRSLADQVPSKLPQESTAPILALETYALAAWCAHVVHSRVSSKDEIKRLFGDAKRVREELLVCAELLARMGHVDGERVAAIRTGTGKLDLASDLVAVAAVLEEAWPRIADKVPLKLDDVKRGAALGTRLLSVLSAEDGATSLQEKTADRRARAFTLLVRAYDACRRIVTYLRWAERDVETLVPSLFDNLRGRRQRRRSPADTGAEPATAGATGSETRRSTALAG